jgi:hypothetical protein
MRLKVKLKVSCRLFFSLATVALFGFGPAHAWAAPGTTTTLTITSGSSAVTSVASGSVVTLTAAVVSGSVNVTTGQVNFCDAAVAYCTDIHLLATAQLTGAGTATFSFRPGVGSHTYKAVFAGTPSYAWSASATGALTVTHTGQYLSETEFTWTGSKGNYSLTATVGGAGATAPTGAVSFLDTSNGNALLGTGTLGAALTSPNFLTVTSPTVPGSNLVVEADFNGDGIPDLAVTSSGSKSISILIGNGDGTFTATPTPGTGDFPAFMTVGDFNGDGIPDLAVVGFQKNLLTILLGNGDGTFSVVPSSPSVGGTLTSIAAGDFNGDGIPDLIVSNSGEGAPDPGYPSVAVFLGNGDGTFSEPVTTSLSLARRKRSFRCRGWGLQRGR